VTNSFHQPPIKRFSTDDGWANGDLVLWLVAEEVGMAFPNDDPTVHQGDRTIQLIDWLVGRLEECLGEVSSMESAIEQLKRARAKKEQQPE
jgi:hypothetical protein